MCEKAFALKHVVKVHFQRLHSEVRPFVCDVCNKMFAIQNDLKRHKTIHTEERPYHCDVCNVSFCYLKALTENNFQHNNDYPCPCDLVKFSRVRVTESTQTGAYCGASLHM